VTVLLTTLLGILVLSISARRGWNWNLRNRIVGLLSRLPLLGERTEVRAVEKPKTQNAELETILTRRERRC
jgi:hypothetical protein